MTPSTYADTSSLPPITLPPITLPPNVAPAPDRPRETPDFDDTAIVEPGQTVFDHDRKRGNQGSDRRRNSDRPSQLRQPVDREARFDETFFRDTVRIWGISFDRLDMRQSIDAIERLIRRQRPSYVVTANLNYCMLHEQDPHVRQISRDADLVLADGQPIVLRSRLTPDPLPTRVAGSEMILHLCQRAAELGWRVYFLGGAEGIAETCAAKLQRMYPGLQIAGTDCPPFRKLTPAEQAAQLDRIRDASPDLLFVAFGQPKGEKWIYEHYRSLGVPVSIQLGASFDFIAGTATRAPKIFQQLALEWAFRMMTDPRRLMPRYASNAAFLIKALIYDWRQKVTTWGMGQWV